jgi:hypothetical protein
MKNFSIFFIAITVGLLSCDNSDEMDASPEDFSYFPLEVGNLWEYEPLHPERPVVASALFTIVDKETRNGKEYFVMERILETAEGTKFTDSVSYRIDSRGYVFELYKFRNYELNTMRLGASNGDSWSVEQTSNSNLIALTTFRDITRNGETLTRCKEFYYNAKEVMDEERAYVLAKGIGIIQYTNAWGFDYKLKRARISGIDR